MRKINTKLGESRTYLKVPIQSNLCATNALGTPEMWTLLTGGRYSEVTYHTKIEIGTPKLGSFLAGGCYSEVVVNLGLTLFKSMG